MLVPVYGFVHGDALGLLVLVQHDDTVAVLGDTLQQAASVRVAPRPTVHLVWKGQRLDPSLTLDAAGLKALDRVDLIGEDDGAP